MSSKKENLIILIEKEKDKFDCSGFDTSEHVQALGYLKTGKIPKHSENNELLDCIIHDYDTVCKDYGAV